MICRLTSAPTGSSRTAWDATFTLFDGEPSDADLTRLAANVPLQEAGRISDTELSLSRANRSVRLWDHVVASLARGAQPAAGELDQVGYLMRTTAVYGSGKFGACDRAALLDRGLMAAPFHIEMLSVWLIRAFTLDLVEHMAQIRGGPAAVKLDPALRRRLGVGNSTGLGMAPFLVNHPALLHAWIDARETAIARVRALPIATAEQQFRFREILARARLSAGNWRTDHPAQRARCATLQVELAQTERHLQAGLLATAHPWDALMRWAGSTLSLEGQEQLAALILEPYPELVDELAATMQVDEQDSFRIDGAMPVSALRSLLARNYAWAYAPDYAIPAACARFWYVSAEKLEPRLGARHAGTRRGIRTTAGRRPLCRRPRRGSCCLGPAGRPAFGVPAHPPRAPPHRPARAALRHPPLRRNPRQHDCRRDAPDRHHALQALLLRRDPIRPPLRPLGTDLHVPERPLPARARCHAGRRLDLSAANPAGGMTAPSLSLAEIDALCRKAARGAGCPWGMAEEAGKAARWLASHGLPGPEALAALLDAPRNCRCGKDDQAPGCALALGAQLSDEAEAIARDGATFGAVSQPLLMLAQAGLAAAAMGVPVALHWAGFRAICVRDGISLELIETLDAPVAADVACMPAGAPASPRLPSDRARAVASATLDRLERLAALTYAPATDASRTSGAGAANLDTE